MMVITKHSVEELEREGEGRKAKWGGEVQERKDKETEGPLREAREKRKEKKVF